MASETAPAFSIIVPVYNGEHVIENCIKSVLGQSYTLYELIIIDDGSKDKTHEVCQKYYSIDSRIKYHKQENAGVSAARNNAIKMAQNEYILFVDADDYLLPDFVQSFNKLIVEKKVDTTTFVFQDFIADLKYKNGTTDSFNWCKFSYGKYSLEEALNKLTDMNWLEWGVPFAKLYRSSIIKNNTITFNEKVSFREDAMFMIEYLKHIDTIIFDPTANYHYAIDYTKSSLSNSTASFESEIIFFEFTKQIAALYSKKFKLTQGAQNVLYKLAYESLFRSINSCMYKYKVPMPKHKRIENLRSVSTTENIDYLFRSGVVNSKMKQVAVSLLKNKLYQVYDTLNKVRFNLT
ncbi:glycosyltransferase [Hymenobacter tibetensis]|uniref:Glycosyltransferase n=1 Tax=Hymenobacter tibetensis TaxID=497967 RepID=A0ABY4CXW5_9BACT|nr:glycosyltransferase family 2 protein [Hymenobacter tibetensis]UOG75108.1 glycosyltransferase [Hymenobacter tibetensis]